MNPSDYSLSRLLAAVVNHREDSATYELEVSEELRCGLATEGHSAPKSSGIFVPLATLNSTTPAAGGATIVQHPGGFIGPLRPRLALARLGASITAGSPPPLRVTTQESAGTFTWMDENPGSDLDESEATFGERILTMRSGASIVTISRQLLKQATPSGEQIIRRDLGAIAGRGIEKAAIQGSGVAPVPLGLLNTEGIQVYELDPYTPAEGGTPESGGLGAAPDYAALIRLEEMVANVDADREESSLGFLTTATMRRKLRETEKAAGAGMVWGENGLLGLPSAVTTLVPSTLATQNTTDANTDCHAIIYGDWSRLHIALYALELIVDPVTRAREGLVEIMATAHVGIAVSHPSAFAAILDARDV